MREFFSKVDPWLFVPVLPILFFGLVTMNSFEGSSQYFNHQLIWIGIAFVVCFVLARMDLSILRRGGFLLSLYVGIAALLLLLFALGHIAGGAQSWFSFGSFAFQPTDFAKIILIVVLAKYFSRRHVEIAHYKHILMSAGYTFFLFALIFFQPDFGSAMILLFIWFGMILISGISKKHLLIAFGLGIAVAGILWFSILQPYQKARVLNFLHPYTDIQGSGYNAYQSTIAVGSGQLLGKGVGYGTQSRLQFLPEYQTDFIFAAFAEEWGFVGVLLLFISFGFLFYRLVDIALRSGSNFELLTAVGVALYFMSHFIVNVGMNIGVLPVTGVTLPFMSYGGSHLIAEFAALGIVMNMGHNVRATHRSEMKNELVGI